MGIATGETTGIEVLDSTQSAEMPPAREGDLVELTRRVLGKMAARHDEHVAHIPS